MFGIERNVQCVFRLGILSPLASHDHAIVSAGGSQRREEATVLLHQPIDTYHQSLAKKPDAAFCTEMLAKALVDALNETDFFMTSGLDDGGDPPPQHHHHQQQQQGEVGEMFGSLSSTNLSTSRGIGDDWAKDGLSLSVESASHVDTT